MPILRPGTLSPLSRISFTRGRGLTPIVESQEDEGLYQKMNSQYDGVHMIQSAEFFRLLPHFEVEGR